MLDDFEEMEASGWETVSGLNPVIEFMIFEELCGSQGASEDFEFKCPHCEAALSMKAAEVETDAYYNCPTCDGIIVFSS